MLMLFIALGILLWYCVAAALVVLPVVLWCGIAYAVHEAKIMTSETWSRMEQFSARSSVGEQHRVHSPNAHDAGREFESHRAH